MKLEFHFLKNRSIFQRWLFSYFSILVIPLIISNIVFINTENIVQQEVKRANTALLKQMQQTVDARIQEIGTLSFQIGMSPNLIKFLNAQSSQYENDPLSKFSILKELNALHTNNSFIYGIYIYFPSDNTVISSSSACSAELFYNQIHRYQGLRYGDWFNNILNSPHFQDWVPVTITDNKDKPANMVMLLQSIPIDSGPGPKAQCMIMVDENNIRKALGNVEWVSQGDVLVLDSRNQTIVSTASFDYSDFKYSNFPYATGTSSGRINNEEMHISYLTSEVTNWKYISLIPSRIFMEKVEYVRKLTIISVTVCILVGMLVSLFLVKRNYHPIKDVMTSLPVKLLSAPSRTRNELSYIKDTISMILDESRQMSRKIYEQKPIMRANFIAKLLKGKVLHTATMNDTMAFLNMEFASEDFGIILMHIDTGSESFSNSAGEEWAMLTFILSNVIEELASQTHKGYFFELDDYLGCLLNFTPGTTEKSAKEDMTAITGNAREFLQAKFNVHFTAGVSDVNKSICGIPEAYNQARKALDHLLISAKSENICCYSEIHTQTAKYIYPLEIEQQLVNFVKAGDYEHTGNILDKIFSQLYKDEGISIFMVRCLIFDMMSTAMKTTDELNLLEGSIDGNEYVDKITTCKTIKEMHTQIVSLFKQVCEYFASSRKSHSEDLKCTLIKFLEENYADCNLSINAISKYFDMNGIYLSRVFKEQTGCSLIDYLNKVRIKHAKKLLDSKFSISEIASKTGYTNISTLMRTFKKYEGVTPGQYREIRQAESKSC